MQRELCHDPERRPALGRSLIRLPSLAYRLLRWRALRGGWALDHLRSHRRFDRRVCPPDRPIDILVLCADHFEPARRHGDTAAVESVRRWCADYEALAGRHRDSDGRPPQHTWFYRYDYPNEGCLRELCGSVYRGFGEVEFHLHHGHDTAHSFAARLEAGLAWFGRYGAMRTAEALPRPRFGYIAGNWALDNGAGDDSLSGCDTELAVLREVGCYADFTYPALGSRAQPCLTNAIYYAREDGRPGSHIRGERVVAGRRGEGDLMIFQGPTSFNWESGCVDDGEVEDFAPAHPRRMASWLQSHVHVPGRPEWVFIKLSTHAMQSQASFLGAGTDATFAAMGAWWTRPPFRLHYVTAREAYNVVRAAEAGHEGNPADYLDYEVPPPANRVVRCDRPWRLLSHTPGETRLRLLDGGPARVEFRTGAVRSVCGRLGEVCLRQGHGLPVELELGGAGEAEVVLRDGGAFRVGPGGWRGPVEAPGSGDPGRGVACS